PISRRRRRRDRMATPPSMAGASQIRSATAMTRSYDTARSQLGAIDVRTSGRGAPPIRRSGTRSPAMLPAMPPTADPRPLKVGIQLPEVEREVRWPEYVAMARLAEDVGFDSL